MVALLLTSCGVGALPAGLPRAAGTPDEQATLIVAPASATPTATRIPESPTASSTPGLPMLTDQALQNQVARLAGGFTDTGRNPGLSVAIVKRDPQTGQLQAMLLNFGTTAKGGGQPVDSGTVYEIGSITKVFTGILLAEAVKAGKMNLNDPIQAYLPQGIQAPSYKGTPITLADLATHRSGLPRDLNSDSVADLYGWLNGFHLSRAPGSEYVYSNLGYSLLGDILARDADTDYETLVFRLVSQPLGMMDTTETLSADQASRLAQGYSGDGSPAQYFPTAGAMSSAGYLHSTLRDMTRFLVANMQPDSTPLADSMGLAQSLQAGGRNPGTGTGLGWEIDRLGRKDQRVWKAGATYGFSSYISFASDGSSGFVLLSNGQYVDSLAPYLIQLLSEPGN